MPRKTSGRSRHSASRRSSSRASRQSSSSASRQSSSTASRQSSSEQSVEPMAGCSSPPSEDYGKLIPKTEPYFDWDQATISPRKTTSGPSTSGVSRRSPFGVSRRSSRQSSSEHSVDPLAGCSSPPSTEPYFDWDQATISPRKSTPGPSRPSTSGASRRSTSGASRRTSTASRQSSSEQSVEPLAGCSSTPSEDYGKQIPKTVPRSDSELPSTSKSTGTIKKQTQDANPKFMEDFDPERSNREKRKITRMINDDGKNIPSVYDEKGVLRCSGLDLCDCLIFECPGCHYPCRKCKSQKCGTECRVNRKWVYESVEIEGIDNVIKPDRRMVRKH